MKGILGGLYHFFNQYSRMSIKADRIKSDEEKKKKSAYFAASSMLYSIMMIVFAALGAWMFSVYDDTILFLFVLVFAIAFLIAAALMLLWSFVSFIFQLRMNRTFWTWFCLIFMIVAVVASLYSIYFFLGGAL